MPHGVVSAAADVPLKGISHALVRLGRDLAPRTKVVYLFQDGGGLCALGTHQSADPDAPDLLLVEHRHAEERLRTELGEHASPPRTTLPLAPLDELLDLFREGRGASESVWIRGDTIVRLDLWSDEEGLPAMSANLLKVDVYFAGGAAVVGLLEQG